MSAWPFFVVLAQLASTYFMTGLIWFVQVVHYPLFSSVGSAEFGAYQKAHMARTTWVVAPVMLIEALTAVLLLWLRPGGVAFWQVGVGILLLAGIWFSTFWLQVPCHDSLCVQFDRAMHGRLVWSNWLRTVLWSLRAVLISWMTIRIFVNLSGADSHNTL